MAFPARYDGHCEPCDEPILKGDAITNHPQVGYIHEECAEDVGNVRQSNGADFDAFAPRIPSHGIAVLPRGKTGKDRCDQCFIVHTPGQDGCE